MVARTEILRHLVETDHLPYRLVVVAEVVRNLAHKIDLRLLHPYHPERHYMRGPGPRWRAKHGNELPPTGVES